MSTQVVVQGTLKLDGTLELDEKLPLPAGRVQVTVQAVLQPEPGDGFWIRMEAIWAAQKARGHTPRSVEEVESERKTLRDESEEELRTSERTHEHSSLLQTYHSRKMPGNTSANRSTSSSVL